MFVERMFGGQMFAHDTPEDGGGGPGSGGDYQRVMNENPLPAGEPTAGAGAAEQNGWQPTQEWGSRIDQFIEGAGPILGQLGELLSQPDEQQGYDPYAQQYDPYAQQPGMPDPSVPLQFQPTGDPAYDQWQQDYINWQQQYGAGAQQQQGGFDPQMFQQVFDQSMAPYAPLLEEMAAQKGEAYANEVMTQIEQEVGSFNREDAITTAQAWMAQGYDPHTALTAAAKHVHEREAATKQAGIEEYKETLMRQAGANGDLGTGGSALETPGVPRGAGRYEEAIARVLSGM